ncbi:MAG: alpha/beta hydrolase family protein [Solirubrobacteraceae bacterium]
MTRPAARALAFGRRRATGRRALGLGGWGLPGRRALGLAAAAVLAAGCGASSAARPTSGASTQGSARGARPVAPARGPSAPAVKPRSPAPKPPPPARPPFAIGERVMTFVDRSRTVRLPSGALGPRRLLTFVRYPARGRPSGVDVPGSPAARAANPFPLVVFGHGFAVTPGIYASLLRAWTRAGYVVAAPLFPLGSATAPGGPDESDLVHQPRDMSFVITSLLHASADPRSPLAHLIDPRAIAVAGQSDGGDTALAAADDRYFLDRRVRAAMILSGAEIPGVGGLDFPAPSPPLLATQGTADTVNPPALTQAFFDQAPAPKFRLSLLGASHLGPYTGDEPQSGIVQRVTIAFLQRYLNGEPGALRRMSTAGSVAGTSVLQSDP